MRIRTIKPEILTDEKSAALTDTSWRLFVSCIVMADDYGNFRASPAFLHSQVFWATTTYRDACAKALETLARLSLVSLYEVGGQQYGHIVGWAKHQRVDHPGKPLCPRENQGNTVTCEESSRESQEDGANIHESLKPDPDQDQERTPTRTRKGTVRASRFDTSQAFAQFWAAYPKKTGKGQAIKAWPGDEHLPAILAALSWQAPTWDPKYTKHPATWLNARCWEDEKPQPSLLPQPPSGRNKWPGGLQPGWQDAKAPWENEDGKA
jgi:hypothetical protein